MKARGDGRCRDDGLEPRRVPGSERLPRIAEARLLDLETPAQIRRANVKNRRAAWTTSMIVPGGTGPLSQEAIDNRACL